MHRRAFLGTLAAAAAGLMLDPERLLWVPGAKTIFLPTVQPVLRASSALLRGDVFTIAGVFAVNPQTGRRSDMLQDFVVTADVTEGAVIGAEVWPMAALPSGQHQTHPVTVPWHPQDDTMPKLQEIRALDHVPPRLTAARTTSSRAVA